MVEHCTHTLALPAIALLLRRVATIRSKRTSLKANRKAAVMTDWLSFGPRPSKLPNQHNTAIDIGINEPTFI